VRIEIRIMSIDVINDDHIMTESEFRKIVLQDLQLIKNKLDIQEKKNCIITDNFDSAVSQYSDFARNELHIGEGTIKNQSGSIRQFLEFCTGEVTENTVRDYLDTLEGSPKNNNLKALKRYIRDYLKLGNWVNDISFEAQKVKIKTQKMPSNEELVLFYDEMKNDQISMIFLICFNSGLRIGEVLQIKSNMLNFELNCIDVSQIHQGETKSAWFGFFTEQAAGILQGYVNHYGFEDDDDIFSVTYNQVYEELERVSNATGIRIKPKYLRTVFVERCIDAQIDKNVIDVFEGRIGKSVQAKHYRDYSPERLKQHYNSVEKYLTL